ncbi:Fic family protein [Kitasatospora phosalacinea]|uniref:Fic family protein n=1 Tax=Kitasatospora phosalacinea TaxID=2065 RepID=A0ABW6GL88_9ACTN
MSVSPLANSPIGLLVPVGGYDPRRGADYSASAYLPNRLPDDLALSGATHNAITRAMSKVARADQAMLQLPNPELLARLVIRQEAVSTSAIEGTYVQMEEVLRADFLASSEYSGDVAEVYNYVLAAEAAADWIREPRPISVHLLEHLQKQLVTGTASDGPQAGRVRDVQVFIGVPGGRVEDARFIPCPPGQRLRDGLLHWEAWINRPGDLPLLARLALGHYQFETLRPFNDGNGRLGRLVMLLQLIAAEELRLPSIALSPWLEANRREYQDHLYQVSVTGDFEPWIVFVCQAIEAQAVAAVRRVGKLVAIRNRMLEELKGHKAKGTPMEIARELIGYPMLTVNAMKDRHGVTYQAANTAVRRLVDLGYLRQFSEGNYDRVFVCDEVLEALVQAP